MTNPRLYVTRLLPAPVMDALTARFDLTASAAASPPSRETVLSGVKDAEALVPTLSERIDAELLNHAPRLRVVANYAVGYNNIDLDAAREKGVIVTNTPDILTETTADLAWALLLAVARRVTEGHRLVQDEHWTGWEPRQLLGSDVYGQTLGIIGMGRIGQAVARRTVGFGMRVIYHSRGPVMDGPADWQAVSFDDVLQQSDFVSLHVPLTAETHHLLGAPQLRRMRPTAYLINTARGPVVDEAALVAALTAGHLAGAGLDVYEREPAIHPGLRTLPNVVTLPHVGSATLATRIRMGMVCLDNLVAVFEGKTPPNQVA
jgi:glyoxylate reductase